MFWDVDTRMDDEGALKSQYIQHGAVYPMPRRQLEKPPHAVGPEPRVETPFWYPTKYSHAARAPVAQARSKPATIDLWIQHEKNLPLTQPHNLPPPAPRFQPVYGINDGYSGGPGRPHVAF